MKTKIFTFFFMLFIFSGCHYSLEYRAGEIDQTLLQEKIHKNSDSILLFSDNKELEVPCFNSSMCSSATYFFKTGEITKNVAQIFFEQQYKNIETAAFEGKSKISNKFIYSIYPQVIEHHYSYEVDGIKKFIVISIEMKVSLYDNSHRLVFEKNYKVDGLKSNEYYRLSMNNLLYLRRAFQNTLLSMFSDVKKDIDKLDLKEAHE